VVEVWCLVCHCRGVVPGIVIVFAVDGERTFLGLAA